MRAVTASILGGAASLAVLATHANAATLVEGFENVPGLTASGWRFSNQSTQASANTWRQGNPSSTNSIGPAPAGPADSYALANFTDTGASVGTISNWMITPALAFNGEEHTVSFLTRTATNATFPDRLEVRLSTTDNLTGTSPTDVGSFTSLLLSVNPNLQAGPANYPDTWTSFTATVPAGAAAGNGFIAFRYFVTNGGANGANSNIIGVDSLDIAVIPEPATAGLLALGGLAMLRRRRA